MKMNEKSLRVARPVLVAATMATLIWASAGSLTPPGGPISSTMKDLATVEPRIPISAATTPGDDDSLYKITSPGSYYLVGNIDGVENKMGIEIAADGVTLDLMGFDLAGVPGSMQAVAVMGASTNIAIHNGSVHDWDWVCVDASFTTGTRLTDLSIRDCLLYGIIAGDRAIVTRCLTNTNGFHGISADGGSVITNCSARNSESDGIAADSSTIVNSSASQNGRDGISGFGSTIINCSAYNNGRNGISTGFAGEGSAIIDCVAGGNTDAGIEAVKSTIKNCTLYQNLGDGISADGCSITNCTSAFNQGNGILADRSEITGCTVGENGADGLHIGENCTVLTNACNSNGFDGAGIYVTTGGNRIEDNHCTGNGRGIDVGSAGNLIVRNSCSSNSTNYEIVAGNRYGPIIDVTAGGTLAVSGNSAPSTLTSTDPSANYAY